MLEVTTVRTTPTPTPTASRLDGGVRHFVHRSARSWSGSVLKPRVNKLWRRLAGERTSERASGQLTNLPNVTPTTEAEPLGSSAELESVIFCSDKGLQIWRINGIESLEDIACFSVYVNKQATATWRCYS
ncbi:hypothetical protein G5I_05373 [Acromyrmex echinatior]|uniref:Uncharacterized protein n=1 Tax=Acromyrmex echinatior TaxID=103372 RepID=F4WI51_ACREC|nr:hypothetical protein G5I_05373 [Acromyrmex echinatior]